MITPRDIAKKTMTKQKRLDAKNDLIAFYVGRPISYLLSVPFISLDISPNMLSLIAVIPLILSLFVFNHASSTLQVTLGWSLLFLWNLFDGVDGNVARYKKISSKLGSVYDAMGGYLAMFVTFFGPALAFARMNAEKSPQMAINVLTIGAISGLSVIFPRLIMHKAISTLGASFRSDGLNNKAGFGPLKVLALNITSITGLGQLILLISIIFNVIRIFEIVYLVINVLIMLKSLRAILSQN